MKNYLCGILVMVCLLVFVGGVGATQKSDSQREIQGAWDEAGKVRVKGPVEIPLLDQGRIKIPAQYSFVPQPQASKVMEVMGNGTCPEMVGFIISEKKGEEWIVTVDYTKSGYIKDDDAKNWNVEELLKSIKDGTKENNKDRRERGLAELNVIGWVEKPQYDANHHYLVWSMESQATGEEEHTINYNTYALGREGYLTLTLITDMKKIGAEKVVAKNLLAATEFVPGKRYEEFNATTDTIAEYGLAALVTGVVAKKMGIFAMIGVFLLKFIKVIIIGVGALGVMLFKNLRSKKKNNEPVDPPNN